MDGRARTHASLLAILLRALGADETEELERCAADWLVFSNFEAWMTDRGLSQQDAECAATSVRLALRRPKFDVATREDIVSLIRDEVCMEHALGVNKHEGVRYISRESLEACLRTLAVVCAPEGASHWPDLVDQVLDHAESCEYRFDEFLKPIDEGVDDDSRG